MAGTDVSSSLPWYAPNQATDRTMAPEQSHALQEIPFLIQLLDAVADIILVINDQGQIVFANHALAVWLGLDDQRAIYGKLTGQVLGCTHAAISFGCGTREICRTCGAAHAISAGLHGQHAANECRITRLNGQALDLRVVATPFSFDNGEYSVFTLQDIADEKRRLALERVFYHDILNVAGMLTLASQSLTMETEPDRIQEIYVILQDGSERLVEMIKSTRDLTRAEQGELQPIVEPVHSLRLLERVCSFYSLREVAKQCPVVVAPGSEDTVFLSDSALLERVLGNMVKNAVEASKPEQTVTLRCGQSAQRVWFEVRNAAFMPRQIQLQVFQRSFSTKGEGRGLGTYSIKLLTERYLKGTVEFESSREHGTAFRAFYPLEI